MIKGKLWPRIHVLETHANFNLGSNTTYFNKAIFQLARRLWY